MLRSEKPLCVSLSFELGRSAGACNQSAVERPDLTGRVGAHRAGISASPSIPVSAGGVATLLLVHQRDHHPRRLLQARIEHALDLLPSADIDPADGKQPDHAGGRHQYQEQSCPERCRCHGVPTLMR